MGCCESLAKFLLILINFFFLAGSLLMLGLGIALVVAPANVISFGSAHGINLNQFSGVSDGYFVAIIKDIGIFMIVLGSIVSIISFFGFVGACCENSCMLGTYAAVLIAIVLAEIALIIFAAVYPNVFENDISQVMNTALTKTFQSDIQLNANGGVSANSSNPNDVAWMSVQFAFNCCGAYNYTDYNSFKWTHCGSQCTVGVVPISCCVLNNPGQFPSSQSDFSNFPGCQASPPVLSAINSQGCASVIYNDARTAILQFSKIAIGIAAGIVGLEIILIILAFMICCRGRGSKAI